MVQSVRPQDASSVYRRTLGAVTPSGEAGSASRSASPARSRRADSVALSDQARLLAHALEAAAQAPDARAELVESLRASVQNGTYTPDPVGIAAGMLAADEANASVEGAQS